MLDIYDVDWLAGFLEGEGCFAMSEKSKNKSPRIMISQKQKWPLGKVLSIIGFGSIQHMYYNRSRDIYCYSLSCNKAIQWMMTLYILMSPRRQEQIRRVIKLWKERPKKGTNNRNKTHCLRGHEFTKENTSMYISKDGKIHRKCNRCNKERIRKKYYKIKKLGG